MGRRGFLIVLAIVLLYLIARPHVATFWHVAANPTASPVPVCCAPLPVSQPPVTTFVPTVCLDHRPKRVEISLVQPPCHISRPALLLNWWRCR